ncbi:hypothetical protein CDAR_123991 [Caerostris darwini]|uniref:Uncharacterized protein n=1 Tax=Caerostris darwini TaxID=1538125 RepID=A0AAV4TNI0_9ARAC|nr:hypothetical protein CDAR_123991 [Caerostris darwini]
MTLKESFLQNVFQQPDVNRYVNNTSANFEEKLRNGVLQLCFAVFLGMTNQEKLMTNSEKVQSVRENESYPWRQKTLEGLEAKQDSPGSEEGNLFASRLATHTECLQVEDVSQYVLGSLSSCC